jgi:putative endonuclease
MKQPAVYILASERNGTLYIGVTSDLIQRIWQHKESLAEGFTKKYDVKMLVWYEQHETMESAIAKEKAMKKWLRKWKLATIEKTNPDWRDLWPEIIGEAATPVIPASPVVPANAGTQQNKNALDSSNPLDSRIRGNDGTLGGAR